MYHTLQVVIEHDKDGYFAYVPGLKGCHSQGDSLEDTLKHIREATELYLETLTRAERQRLMKRSVFTTSMSVAIG